MAIFDDEEVVSYAVASVALVQEIPNLIPQAVLYAVMNNSSIADSLMALNFSSFTQKGDAYYRYGYSDYVLGLPEGDTSYSQYITKEQATKATDRKEGKATTVTEIVFNNPSAHYCAIEYIQGLYPDFQLSPQTPLFDILPGHQCFYSVSRTAFQNNDLKIGFFYDVQLAYKLERRYTYKVIPRKQNVPHYHMTYHINSKPDFDKWWVYNPEDGTYPEFDIEHEAQFDSPYYPIIPVRQNHRFTNADKSSELYKTGSKLGSLLGMDLDDITDSLATNPDLEDITDAFLVVGIDIGTKTQDGLMYLFEWLHEVHIFNKSVGIAGEYFSNNETSTDTYYQMTITEGNYKTIIRYSTSYTRRDEVGVKAPVGEYSSRITTLEDFPNMPGITNYNRFLIYHQTSANRYDRIELTQLEMYTTGLYDGGVVHRTTRQIKYDKERMVIPLNRRILKSFPGLVESNLLYESLNLIIYAVHIEEVEWYKTEKFINFVQIIVTIVTAVFLAPQLGVAINAGLQQLIILGIKLYLENLIINYAIEWLVEEVGGDIALVIAAVATVAAASFQSFNFGSINGLPWADELLKLASVIIAEVNQTVVDDLVDLAYEQEEFLKEAEEKQEELDAARDLLGTSVGIDILNLVTSTQVNFNESPDEFFNRTIHNTNPGLASLDAIGYYVEGALKLPKVGESII